MERDVHKLRKEIAKRYEERCKQLGVKRHEKLYLNLIEPVATGARMVDGEEKKESQILSISLIYRGNYKMYFTERIKDEDFEILCDVLMDFAELITHMDFSFNEITEKSTKAFANLLEASIKLESLNLQYNYLGPLGCQRILDALTQVKIDGEGSSSLVYLNLEGNDVMTDGIMGVDANEKLFGKDVTSKIQRFLENNKDLEELNLANNKIDEVGMIEIVSQLNSDANSTSLAVLTLDNPFFSSLNQTTAFHVGRMLQSKYCPIEKLSLRKFDLNDEGLAMICENLIVKEKNNLRVLDIGANKITYKGCIALSNMLQQNNCVLKSLIMNNNRTGYFGAKAMATAIEKNDVLVHLDMTTNDITDDGLYLIANALKNNSTLFSLKLYYNHFGDQAKREFFELLRKKNDKSSQRERLSDWFLDFTIYKVDESIQIAHVDNRFPDDIYVPRKYYVATDLI